MNNLLLHFFKKRIGIGMGIGFLAGTLILGMGGRLAMRFISIMAGRSGGFSWGGTLDVVLLGLIIGVLSGGVYGFVGKYGFSSVLLNGCLYGLLLFIVVLILPIDGKGAARGFPEMQPAIYFIFATVFVLYGIVLAHFFKKQLNKSN